MPISVEGRWKSAKARPEDHCGCSSVVTLLFAKKSLTKTNRCAGALSWRRNQLFVLHFSGRLLLTASLIRQRKSMYSYFFTVAIPENYTSVSLVRFAGIATSFSPGLRDKFLKSDPTPTSRFAGHDITPRSTSCRLVYITAYFTALVLLAAYSAALISSLTVYRSNLPFRDLEGILRDRTYKLGVIDKSEIYYTVSVSW